MRVALAALTRRGRWFAIVGVVAASAAILGGQRDLLRLGILLLALPLIGVFLAMRTKVRLDVTRTLTPPRVEAGMPVAIRLDLVNRARVPSGILLVEDTLPMTLGYRPRFVLDHAWSRFRRAVTYTVHPPVRGEYTIGPLAVRVTDPFGMVELRRTFSDTAKLIATPKVIHLPKVRLHGEWSGSGESRPRAIAAAGEEDATVREYRHGDDMRRVHWRATARHGELMVRREEQPWQSRASLLLDMRTTGHAGEGIDSSVEWSVVAAASIGAHLARRGYATRLLTDDGGVVSSAWHDSAGGAVDALTPLLDALAVVQPRRDASVGKWPDLLAGAGTATGLLVAVLGRLTHDEARLVAGLRHGTTAAIAVMVDVVTWTSMHHSPTERVRVAEVTQILRRAGWTVVEARRGQHLASMWEGLGLDRTALHGDESPDLPETAESSTTSPAEAGVT